MGRFSPTPAHPALGQPSYAAAPALLADMWVIPSAAHCARSFNYGCRQHGPHGIHTTMAAFQLSLTGGPIHQMQVPHVRSPCLTNGWALVVGVSAQHATHPMEFY